MTIFSQAKEKVEQFRAHREEYVKFEQLMQDLDLGFVLDSGKVSKYVYWGFKNYYGNTPAEVLNKYLADFKVLKMSGEGGLKSYEWTVKNIDDQLNVFYTLHTVSADNIHYEGNEFIGVHKNPDYDLSYTTRHCCK